MFSVVLHSAGRPFALVEPLKYGPRHCGQSSACVEETASNTHSTKVRYTTNQNPFRMQSRKWQRGAIVACAGPTKQAAVEEERATRLLK